MSRINVANFRHPDGASDNINLTDTGRVGVGTSSPAETLDVNGNIVVNNVLSSGGNLNLNADTNSAGNKAIVFKYQGGETARIDSSGNLKFNSGYGSVATAYGVRAWVNFNGTGTVAIREDGNVSSITDSGTGNYIVNFATAMPDANYAAVHGTGNGDTTGALNWGNYQQAQSTTAYRFLTTSFAGSDTDTTYCSVAFFR